MAHIFKHPTKNAKGILVFTHKEWPWLLKTATPTLKSLKEYYYLGYNVGGYLGKIEMTPLADFTFSSKSTLRYDDNGNTLNIPLCGRNFLTEAFEFLNIEHKQFDIISTSRAVTIKQLPALLHAIKKLNTRGIYPKTLLVIPTAENERPGYADTNIVNIFKELFTPEEQKNITMMRLSPELGFLGLNQDTLNWFYNNSKLLYIGSKMEGNCRVAHEALLGGCDVVYFKNHVGALVDYLDDTNSISYNNHNEIDIALEQRLKDYKHDPERGEKFEVKLSNRLAFTKLKPYFEQMYEKNGEVFDGELINMDNLSNRLPAHYKNVPWDTKDPKVPTADIKTIEQLTVFVNYLKKYI